jgi:hypothetical protein
MKSIGIPTVVSVHDAAKLSGLSEYTVRRFLADYKIATIRSGRKIYLSYKELAELFENGAISRNEKGDL